IDSLNLSQRIVLPKKAAEFRKAEGGLGRYYSPYTLFAAIAEPNFSRAVGSLAFSQTRVDEAQIVCALERHHLARGSYPEKLTELVPQYIARLPHDIIGGQPLTYIRTTDGRFILYSVGWNEKDEGGSFNSADYEIGDWTWQ